MTRSGLTQRALKTQIRNLLREAGFAQAMRTLEAYPARRAVNPLFAFFCSGDPLLRWRAVSGMGAVVNRLAEVDMEAARVVMRRLMWTLNDESGGIGWGAPEAIGEITARHAALANEYGCILVSYIRPDCNFLEHPVLQRGLLWGLGRLAHARPSAAADALPFVAPFCDSSDPSHRGHAAWFLSAYPAPTRDAWSAALTDDAALFTFYFDGLLMDAAVRDAAAGHLPPLSPAGGAKERSWQDDG